MSFCLQAGYFILLARLLGSTQYGRLVGAAALVSIVGQYSSLGSGMVLLRYVSQDRSKFAEFSGNAILPKLAVGLAIIIALDWLGKAGRARPAHPCWCSSLSANAHARNFQNVPAKLSRHSKGCG